MINFICYRRGIVIIEKYILTNVLNSTYGILNVYHMQSTNTQTAKSIKIIERTMPNRLNPAAKDVINATNAATKKVIA